MNSPKLLFLQQPKFPFQVSSEEEIPEEDQTTELNEDDTLLAPENAVSDIEDPAETATDIEEESDESEVDETDLIDTDISEPEIGR